MTVRKSTTKRRAASRDLAGHDGFSLISNQQLLMFFKGMLQCEALEKGARKLAPERRFPRANGDLYAPAVACAYDLKREDTLVAAGGSTVFAWMKKLSLQKTLTQQASQRLIQPAKAQAPAVVRTAVQTALQDREAGRDALVVAFAEADADEPKVAEALTTAIREKLPILFVFLPGKTASDKGKSKLPVFPRIPTDIEDAVALYRVASESMQRIRRGNGPALIEGVRFTDPALKASGPIAKMEAYLRRKNLWKDSLRTRTQESFAKRIEAAASRAKSA